MKAFPFVLVYIVPTSVIIGWYLGGFFTFLTPFLVFVLVPVLDIIVGDYTDNPPEEMEKELEGKKAFRVITWFASPATLGMVIWGAYIVSSGSLTPIEFIGLTISVGINSGVLGINTAHEMRHRVNNKFEPMLARLTLLPSLYMHWGLEHITGHHRWVATPEDPATAKLDQSFYAFWPQTVFGSIASAWKFETERLKRKEKSLRLFRNRVFYHFLVQIAFTFAILYIFGFLAFIFFLLQALISISLLEIINYIEHYGLLRMKDENGRYERVKPIHSWNSSKRLTNWFLFNLQRHSDHHFKPGRRYQLLRHHEESPQLPTGYAGMVLLALIPPIYKRIMKKYLEPYKSV